MRSRLVALAASTILAVLAGCCCYHAPYKNGACPPAPEACNNRPAPAAAAAPVSAPSGEVAYPYYTTRGPRDFLQTNPQTIGP